jgi:hypothetical protein
MQILYSQESTPEKTSKSQAVQLRKRGESEEFKSPDSVSGDNRFEKLR